jgi:two-component system sensor histidine kinase CpxA
MKTPLSLSARVYSVALLNLLMLLGVLVAIAHFEFHIEFRSLLFAPARDRVVSTAREAALDLEQTPVEARTALMGRYRATYRADFYLFSNEGEQLAGKPVTLPADVGDMLARRRPPPGRGQEPDEDNPPPLPRRDDPPPRRDGRKLPRPPEGRVDVFQRRAAGLFWVGVRIPISSPEEGRPVQGALIIAAPSFYGTPLFFDFMPWLIALGAAIVSFFLCWLPFIRGLTRTVARITRATEQIAEGEFDHHLPDDRGDELGQLSVAINRMADRLAGFVGGQKRFLGDIAHELCAPIARMQFGLGILERRASEDQQPAMEDVQDEMRHMTNLVNELLSFSKAGMRSDAHPPAPVEVAQTVRDAVAREASADPSQVQIDVEEPLIAMADREYLLRAVSNLVRNAMRYAGTAGPIAVSARRQNNDVVILVSDCGSGIPEEEIDRVFTPFYRLETSRNRQTGGVGLGLAIVRSCVEACNGKVLCRNRKPCGLEVEIRLAAASV